MFEERAGDETDILSHTADPRELEMVVFFAVPYIFDPWGVAPENCSENDIPGDLVLRDVTFVPVTRWEDWQPGLEGRFERDVVRRDDPGFNGDVLDILSVDDK